MCGRYYIAPADERLRPIIAEAVGRAGFAAASAAKQAGEIFPTNIVPVVDAQGPRLMKWGFAGHGRPIINARSETAFDKPMFRRALMERRCAIPASGYYEWRGGAGGAKEKVAFYRPEGPLFMAGLWLEERGEGLPVFVILTREAPPDIRAIHHRMPVILPEAPARWIEGGDIGGMLARAVEALRWQAAEGPMA